MQITGKEAQKNIGNHHKLGEIIKSTQKKPKSEREMIKFDREICKFYHLNIITFTQINITKTIQMQKLLLLIMVAS